ncbi:MAG: TonB-dependent receptor [Cytophagaceae bacterium]|nr:TonB-dependent receptor [Cytophagaceae bacterium]
MITRVLILFSVCFSFIGFEAAAGEINGKALDAKTRKPVEFVNVGIKKRGASEYLPNGTITDMEGNFTLTNIPKGNYTLAFTFVGYVTLEQNVDVKTDAAVNIAPVMLTEETVMLGEVTTVGQRSQMTFDIDKRVFNVDQSIASTGGSASDILSNIPSVEVDPEGEISLRGNTSVTVWINGKNSGLSADNRAQILEQLPAESIEKVEIITNPSARYNPEGTAGIINIVMKDNRKAGYYGSLQAGVDTRGGYNASGNINFSSGKVDAYMSLGRRYRTGDGVGHTYRNNLNADGTTASYLNQERNDDETDGNLFGRAGITYRLTPNDHFSLSAFGMLDDEVENDHMRYTGNVPNSFTQSYRLSEDKNNMQLGNFEAGYKHEFHEKSSLDFTVTRFAMNRSAEAVYTQTSDFADGRTASAYQTQTSDADMNLWEIQLDYINEFGVDNKIEAGYKGDLAHSTSPVETVSGTTPADAQPNHDLYNLFTYNQDVHALYTTYGRRIARFGFQAGLRGEYTRMDTRSLGYGQTNADVPLYGDDYFSLYPSMYLSYELPANNEVQLNYTRRVSRPRGGRLNPFVNIMDSTSITYGNPYLKPQYADALEFNYIKNWDNHTLSASIYYRKTGNVIQRISYIENNVMKTTYENVAKTQYAGSEFILKNNLWGRLDLTSTLNLYYNKLDGFTYLPPNTHTPVVGKADEGFSWNGRVVASMILPHQFSVQLTGNYNSHRLIAQGHNNANGSVDIGIRKSFFDRKLSLTINVRDIFNTRQRITVTSGSGFYQENMFARVGQTVRFVLTYTFGNMKEKITKPSENDGMMNGMDGDEE